MYRSFIFLFLFLQYVAASTAQSQPPDPEPTWWINANQTYFKIPVAQTGLYRITAAELQRAGVPVYTVDPQTVQLFHRGVEQALLVAGQDDGRFDADDFLEFYGRGNDGAQDSLLYQPGTHPHAYYSLFSDTTAYFLTWRLDGKPGKRMVAYRDTSFANLTPEPYHWADELRVFTQTYSAGTIYPLGATYANGAILTDYDTGEGWTGPIITPGNHDDQLFTLTNWFSTADAAPRVRYLLVGRNAGAHRIDYLIGPSAATLRSWGASEFENYDKVRAEADLRPTDISPAGTVTLRVQPRETGEEVSISYVHLRYPQRTDLAGASHKILRLRPNHLGRSYLVLRNTPARSRLYDITDPSTPEPIAGHWAEERWQGVIHNTRIARTVLVTSEPMPVSAIKPVRFRALDRLSANYLIVSHTLLRRPVRIDSAGNVADPVRAYAAYRASAAGGHYDTLTVTIDQLFDQFSYGERHPLAIRRFADYMLRQGGPGPKFLFLIGQSRDPQGVRKAANAAWLDLVPNAGWPGSDLALVAGLNGEPAQVPALAIGRLNASRPQSVLDYLNKVIAHEKPGEPALWRKNSLHLSGGASDYEIQTFRGYVDAFKAVVENPYVGGRVTTRSKQTDNPVETLPVTDVINQGVGMVSMFGHSGLDVSDVDLGFVSNDRLGYRNQGRYPFVLVNGCASGNFYFGRPTFGSDWILTPNRGAVLLLAHTYNGFAVPLKRYADQFYALLTDSNWVARPLGCLQQETIRRYLDTNASVYDVTTAQQMTLQGDPAVRVFPFSRPDIGIVPGSLRLSGDQGDSLTAQSDSITISAVVANYGRVTHTAMTVRIRRYTAGGQLIREQRFTQATPFYADTLRWQLPNDRTVAGHSYFEVVLDPDDRIAEGTETNNQARISTAGPVADFPFPADQTPPLIEVAFDGERIRDDAIVSARPEIAVFVLDENKRLIRSDTTGLELYLQRPCATGNCPYERLSLAGSGVKWLPAQADNAFRLTYQPTSPLPDGRYGFEAISSDLSGNRAAPYQIHFTVRNQAELLSAGTYPNPFSRQTRFFLTLTGQTVPPGLRVEIRDLNGRLVRTLSGPVHVGRNEWGWDGTSETGHPLPSGLYVYTITGLAESAFSTSAVRLSGRILLTR